MDKRFTDFITLDNLSLAAIEAVLVLGSFGAFFVRYLSGNLSGMPTTGRYAGLISTNRLVVTPLTT